MEIVYSCKERHQEIQTQDIKKVTEIKRSFLYYEGMKDLPHHIKKLNRKVIRSLHRQELEEEAYDMMTPPLPPREKSENQIKKQAKIAKRKEAQERAPTPLTIEEKNQKLKTRAPIVDPRINAEPHFTKPTQKKTPKI